MKSYLKAIVAGGVAACTTGAALAAGGMDIAGVFGIIAAGLAGFSATYFTTNAP